jgi:hypothetical protein
MLVVSYLFSDGDCSLFEASIFDCSICVMESL